MPQSFQPLAQLKGKTAWITGGRRIGQTVALALAGCGVNLITSYRHSRSEANQIIAFARRAGVRGLAVPADVTSRSSVAQAVKTVSKTFPRVDILINLASVFAPSRFERITERDWQRNIAVNVLGTFWPVQLISRRMPKGGHIVTVADRTSIGRIYPGYLPYVVTKAAVAAMTRALAVELAGRGIFVNAVAPGPILRPGDITQKEWAANRRQSALKYPIDDNAAVEEFSWLVIYLSTQTMASGYTYPLDEGLNL